MTDAELLAALIQVGDGIQDATPLLQEALKRGVWPPPRGRYLSRPISLPDSCRLVLGD